MADVLSVNEIFFSLQGEGARTGLPCVLIRLAGCNLRCRWCDTTYAWDQGLLMPLGAILEQVQSYRCNLVELTGGEPCLQESSPALLRQLCDLGYETLIETNGSMDIGGLDERVVRIVDLKCPSSGESHRTRWENVPLLRAADEVKFVLADRTDYDFARAAIARHGLDRRCTVLLGPVAARLAPAELARWMLQDSSLPRRVRLNLQLHKIIWPDKDRGV